MTFFVTLSSGRDFHFANPTPAMICLDDVVHHLSRENSWYNNVEAVSFTVAQHSLLVASACRLPQSLPYALLHDTLEMVSRDLSTPFKGFLLSLGADIIAWERRALRDAVWPAFGLPHPTPEIAQDVDKADAIAMATEHRDVVKGRSSSWRPTAKPLAMPIKFMTQPRVEEVFKLKLQSALRPFGKVD